MLTGAMGAPGAVFDFLLMQSVGNLRVGRIAANGSAHPGE